MSAGLWVKIVTDAAPYIDQYTAQCLYHKTAACYLTDTKLTVPDGVGGDVDLTKLFEYCRMLSILKGE